MARPTRFRNRWRARPIDHTGRQLCRTFDTAEEAERWIADVERGKRALTEGRLEWAEEAKTFHDLANYYEVHHLPTLRAKKATVTILRRLREFFGPMVLTDINRQTADQFIEWLQAKPMPGRPRGQKRKPATVRNYITYLGAMLNLAADLEWIERVPRLRKPKVHEQPFMAIDRIEDIQRLLNAAAGLREGAMELYAAALMAGMRQGELAGLQWQYVDFERRLITVAWSWDKPATKSGKVRRVPILDPLLPILQRWREHTGGKGHVFSNGRGGRLIPCNRVFRELWHEALRRAGLPEIRFHDARHSFASLWVQSGGDLYKLQAILGHQSTQMTQRYAHLKPDVFRSEWGRLGGTLDVPAPGDRREK